MRVEWRDGGGRTHLVGVTELGRMLGNDPNLALSVLYGLGRSGGGMDPQRKGWVRVEEGGGETSSSTSGERTPPTKTPKPKPPPPQGPQEEARHFESRGRTPPPKSQDQAQAQGQGQGQAPPPPNPEPSPWRIGAGTPMGMCRVWGTPGMSLDLGDWLVVSQGSNGEGGKKGKKRKREKDRGTFRVPGELLFRTREEAEARLREALREGDDGDGGDDGDDEGDEGGDKGEGGEVGGDKGGEKGGAGSKDAPRQPPTTPPACRNLRKGAWGARGLIGLTHHQVTRRRPAK